MSNTEHWAALEAEVERHRRANLVRAVVNGVDPEWIDDAIASQQFDSIPWRVAESLAAQIRWLRRNTHLTVAEAVDAFDSGHWRESGSTHSDGSGVAS